MNTRELTSRNSAQMWKYLLEEASGNDTLVLVHNLLMEREVRRKWQRDRTGYAPDIRTIESWLEELALHTIGDKELPDLLIHSDERTLWLEHWLSNHPDPEFRRFSGAKTVTAISNLTGSLWRCGRSPGSLFEFLNDPKKNPGHSVSGSRYVLAEILDCYEKEMQKKNWLDGEQLIGLMEQADANMMKYNRVVLYLADEIDAIQEKALQVLSKGTKAPEWVNIRFEESDDEPGQIFIERFHHPREELESAIRHILAQIISKNGNEDEKKSEQHGTRFDDFVILTGDLSLYESMTASVSDRFGVPVYCSRGMPLISHPFVRRLLTYLKLESNGFQIDDIFRVFSDNRIVLPELEENDEHKPPNIRHFSQFCRAYNFRTLDEVSSGLDRVFAGMPDPVSFDNDEEREQKHAEALRRDREYFTMVIHHLKALRAHFKTPDKQKLQDWVTWSETLLDLQKDLMSREANEARELLILILGKLAGSQEKMGLSQKVTRYDFFRLLELRLKETRERPVEQPGGVLMTEINQLPDVHDKTVFILGLHEDGFPRSDRPDFLQFRYERALQIITGRDGSESYDIGRMQLHRILSSEYPRYLSCPAMVDQKKVMPSPLLLELEEQMRQWSRNSGLPGNIEPPAVQAGLPEEQTGSPGGQTTGSLKDQIGSPVEQTESEKEQTRPSEANHEAIILKSWPETRKKWLISNYDTGIGSVTGRITNDKQLLTENSTDLDTVIRRFKLAARVEEERQDPAAMGRYDGVIDRETMEKWWLQNAGNGQMTMSVSKLDTYASSPQDYFFKYMLRLQPLQEYRDDAESNIKGSLLHHILQEFYSVTTEEGQPVHPADNLEKARDRMNSIRERLITAYRHQLGNPESPFPEILKKNLEQVMRWFVILESEGEPAFSEGLDDVRPAVFYPESGFAMEYRWEFEKQLDDITVRFRGIIDRIDITSDGKAAVIYDYKSGRSGVKRYRDILEGRSFQLPVYGMFIQEKQIPYFLAGYYQLPVNGKRKDMDIIFALGSAELIQDHMLYTNAGKRKKNMTRYKPSSEMDDFLAAIENRRIKWIVRAVRDGIFHTSLAGNPKWSDYRYISRYSEQVQHQRANRERTLKKERGRIFEQERYYLAEPVWEDDE